ncbi:MAG TPA: glycosyltransferase family 87 protein [Pyrinomonadaceae bacterium]|nr:glycosyltransferase family 87 protein [Pyrinomonadaceae bacterium]
MKRLSFQRVFICFVSIGLLALYLSVWLSFAGNSDAKRSDFMIYYTAGRLPLSKLYNIDAQREVENSTLGAPFPVEGRLLPFNHTPIFVPLLHLLVNEDYASSYLRWTALLWFTALACAFLIFRMTGDVALTFAAASFYPLFTLVQQAHDAVFMLLGILLGAHLLSLRKDFLAGIALSLATVKPHFAIFLAVPLIAKPKAFLGFCLASALLALYSVLLVGIGGVSEFIGLLKISVKGDGFGMRPMFMFNLLGLMERAGLSPDVARPVAWTAFFVTAISLLVIWKRNPLKPPLALAIVLAVFTSPHLYRHDLALLLASFATLSKPHALLLLGSSLALAVLNISGSKWQFAAAYTLMGVLIAMSIREFRRQAPQLDKVGTYGVVSNQ